MTLHCTFRRVGILVFAAIVVFTSSCRQASESPGAGSADVAPIVGPVTPVSGTGRSQAFRVVVSHPGGAANITDIQVLFEEKMTATSRGACWVEVNSSKFVAVRNEESTAFLPGVAIGSAGTAAGSICSVDASGVKVEAKNTEVAVTLPITFAPAFKGIKKIYVIASAPRKHCDWKETGFWVVN
jgi:hypothetical protein